MNINHYKTFTTILIFIIVSITIGASFAILGKTLSILLGTNNPNKSKGESFECGFPAFGKAREKLNIRFYLIAVLFLIFDLELAFIIPWGINLRNYQNLKPIISNYAFFAMIVFLLILFIGLIYAWKKGALEWD